MHKSECRASSARFVSTTTQPFRDWAHVWPSGPSGPMFVERLQIFARCLRMVVAGSTDIVASANFGRATAAVPPGWDRAIREPGGRRRAKESLFPRGFPFQNDLLLRQAEANLNCRCSSEFRL